MVAMTMAMTAAREDAAMKSMDEAGGRRRRQWRCVGPESRFHSM
jgi:hypothetical protein